MAIIVAPEGMMWALRRETLRFVRGSSSQQRKSDDLAPNCFDAPHPSAATKVCSSWRSEIQHIDPAVVEQVPVAGRQLTVLLVRAVNDLGLGADPFDSVRTGAFYLGCSASHPDQRPPRKQHGARSSLLAGAHTGSALPLEEDFRRRTFCERRRRDRRHRSEQSEGGGLRDGDAVVKPVAEKVTNAAALGGEGEGSRGWMRPIPHAEDRREGNKASALVRSSAVAKRREDLGPVNNDIRLGGVHSFRGIAIELNKRGITTMRGGRWTHIQVKRVVDRMGKGIASAAAAVAEVA